MGICTKHPGKDCEINHNYTNERWNPKNNPKSQIIFEWIRDNRRHLIPTGYKGNKMGFPKAQEILTVEDVELMLTDIAQSGTIVVPGPKPPRRRQERTWTDVFTPQTHIGGGSIGKRGTLRSTPEPVLYSGHMFTGYVDTPTGEVLAVVMKTGKADRFEYERRQTFRTSGLLMKTFEVMRVEKEKQAKAEVDKRNALRAEIRNQFKVYHFGENDAIVINTKDEAAAVIETYFAVAKAAAEKVIA